MIFQSDVPDASGVAAQSSWWVDDQLLLPFGPPPDGIVSIDDNDVRDEQP